MKDNSPEAKAARKAARKLAKKQAKMAAKLAGAAPTSTVDDKAAKKAEKKARKKAKKLAKKAKKEKKRKAEEASLASPAVKKVKKGESLDAIEAWRKKNNMQITQMKGDDADILPFLTFDDARLHFPKKCIDALDFHGYTAPTPIQSQTWPMALKKRDMIGVAKTGSGKTMAFTLPAAALLMKGDCNSQGRFPRMLCLSPTRELAMQIDEVCQSVGKICGLQSHCIFGGVPKWSQRKALKDGLDIVVGTPGRMKDMLENDCLDLSKYVVLDEADRMLDMGFLQEIKAILGATPATRQTLLYSATWPMEIRKLAHDFLKSNPIKINIGSDELEANGKVSQEVEVCDPRSRDQKVLGKLKEFTSDKKWKGKGRSVRIIVFVLYKKEATRVEQMLNRSGWSSVGIHGDKSQDARVRALGEFKSGKVPILVATDVAARGLDIPNVEYVINYSFPLTIEDYVHRIGRTGRAGKDGVSFTFFTENDKARSGELINVLNKAGAKVPKNLLAFGTTVKKKKHHLYGDFAKDVDMSKKGTRITFD
eukprot:g3839.t1